MPWVIILASWVRVSSIWPSRYKSTAETAMIAPREHVDIDWMSGWLIGFCIRIDPRWIQLRSHVARHTSHDGRIQHKQDKKTIMTEGKLEKEIRRRKRTIDGTNEAHRTKTTDERNRDWDETQAGSFQRTQHNYSRTETTTCFLPLRR